MCDESIFTGMTDAENSPNIPKPSNETQSVPLKKDTIRITLRANPDATAPIPPSSPFATPPAQAPAPVAASSAPVSPAPVPPRTSALRPTMPLPPKGTTGAVPVTDELRHEDKPNASNLLASQVAPQPPTTKLPTAPTAKLPTAPGSAPRLAPAPTVQLRTPAGASTPLGGGLKGAAPTVRLGAPNAAATPTLPLGGGLKPASVALPGSTVPLGKTPIATAPAGTTGLPQATNPLTPTVPLTAPGSGKIGGYTTVATADDGDIDAPEPGRKLAIYLSIFAFVASLCVLAFQIMTQELENRKVPAWQAFEGDAPKAQPINTDNIQ